MNGIGTPIAVDLAFSFPATALSASTARNPAAAVAPVRKFRLFMRFVLIVGSGLTEKPSQAAGLCRPEAIISHARWQCNYLRGNGSAWLPLVFSNHNGDGSDPSSG